MKKDKQEERREEGRGRDGGVEDLIEGDNVMIVMQAVIRTVECSTVVLAAIRRQV